MFVLSVALVPLVGLKQQLPVLLYTSALVILHVVVLGVYVYRVRFRELDPDRRSLLARMLALGVVTYLLVVGSSFAPGASLRVLALQMLGVSVLHTAVLVLLMVRVEPREVDAHLDQPMRR